jgi:hypothetical protein
MGPRRWTALAVVALAVMVVFFAIRGTHTDEADAPGRDASKETVKQIPSPPDVPTPRP